jgi:hypothetical protein
MTSDQQIEIVDTSWQQGFTFQTELFEQGMSWGDSR